MRVAVAAGLMVFVLAASALITAQTRNETKGKDEKETGAKSPPIQGKKPTPEKPPTVLTSRMVLSRLKFELDATPFQERMKFKELLDRLNANLDENDRKVTVDVDIESFGRDLGADVPNPLEEEVVFSGNRKRVSAIDLLNHAVKQIGKGSGTVIIRAGRVEILSARYTSKEYMFNQTFRADFVEQRLDAVLEELTELTGVSIVIDLRAKQKAATTVTARFHDDVAFQDALRMLTDMADLKLVYLVTGIYITTPEHAKEMQKELKDIYEPKTPGSGPVMPGGLPPDSEPSVSPLAPPLPPPGRYRRLEAAA